MKNKMMTVMETLIYGLLKVLMICICFSSEGRSNEPTIDASPAENECNGAGSYRVSGRALIFRQFRALFVRRFHYVRRSKKAFMSQVIGSFFILVKPFTNTYTHTHILVYLSFFQLLSVWL